MILARFRGFVAVESQSNSGMEKRKLFLDELNRAQPDIVQPVMDLTHNRTLARKSLPFLLWTPQRPRKHIVIYVADGC
jgi:hypothetical protein